MEHLNKMAIFARVAAAGSFTAAADDLKLSRSLISKSVTSLEAWLGIRLLYRTTRRLTLTEEGRIFGQYCGRILAEAEAAELFAANRKNEPVGKLRVSCPTSFGSLELNQRLPEFMRRYPGISLEIDYSNHFVDLIDSGYDTVIRITSELRDSSLVGRRVTTVERKLVASPDYCRDHGEPKSLDDLSHHNCIINGASQSPNKWRFIRADGTKRDVGIEGSLTVNAGDAVMSATLMSLGIACVPSFVCSKDIAEGRLISLLEDAPLEANGLFVLYPHKHHMAAKTRVFIEFLVEHFAVDRRRVA